MSSDYGAVEAGNTSAEVEVPSKDNHHRDDDEVSISLSQFTHWEICKEEIVMLKWRILIISCFLPFGSYWSYDTPGAIGIGSTNTIEDLFQQHGKTYTSEMNLACYSIYSWPNTVLAFFGGILIDNIIGLRKGMLLFTSLVLVGIFIFWIGINVTNYPLMLFGRFVFGLGGESLSCAQSAYIVRWFKGRRGLALAFGITISFARVGSSFNFLFSPMLAQDISVEVSVLFSVLACAFSLLCCIALIFLDLYGEKEGLVEKEVVKKDQEGGSWFSWDDVKVLGSRFWLLSVICVTIYVSIFPFIGVAKSFFSRKYGVSNDKAGAYVSTYQFVCAGASPILGGIVDKLGRFCQFIIAAAAVFSAGHAMFWLLSPHPVLIMVILGVAYSFVASAIWPGVAYVVPEHSTGLAYGLMTALQNTGLAIFPLISGALLDAFTPPKPVLHGWCLNYSHTDFKNDTGYPASSLINCTNNTDAPLPMMPGFDHCEILYCFTAAVGIFLGIWLYFLDSSFEKPMLGCSADDRPLTPDQEEKKRKEREGENENEKSKLLGGGDNKNDGADENIQQDHLDVGGSGKRSQSTASMRTVEESGGE